VGLILDLFSIFFHSTRTFMMAMQWSGGWYLICFIVGALMLASLVAVYVIHRRKWFVWEDMTVERMGTSIILSSLFFFIFRCCIFGWILGALIVENLTYEKQYQYYTIWNYTLLGGYFLSATLITLLYGLYRDGTHKSSRLSALVSSRWMLYWSRITWVMQQMILILAFLVDIVYWSAVFSSRVVHTPLGWYLSISNHLLNLVFIYGDFLLGQTRYHYAHVIFALIFSEVFVIFQWIYFPVTGVWVYSILNVESPYAILWYIGLLVSLFVFSGIAYGVDALKQRCLSIEKMINKLDRVDEEQAIPSKELPSTRWSGEWTEKQPSMAATVDNSHVPPRSSSPAILTREA
jgi:hypothetical protein